MKTKTYYAIQDKQESGIGRRLVQTLPVLHEFETQSQRDAWVVRGTLNGVSYRQAITPAQARLASTTRIGSAVRHVFADQIQKRR